MAAGTRYDSVLMPSEADDAPENFAEHYAHMTDAELLEIAIRPWLLSDDAWDALEDELDLRGLDLPEPEPAPQISATEKRDLVTVRKFRDLPEALLAKGSLDSAGIESILVDDNMVRMDWLISNLLGGVKLQVDPENVQAANAILDQPIPEELDFDGFEEYQQPRCPKCRSLDVSFEELYRPIAFGSLFVGLPMPGHRKGWICRACRHTWLKDQAEAVDWEDESDSA